MYPHDPVSCRSLSNWMRLRQGKAHATEEENKQSVFAKVGITYTLLPSSDPALPPSLPSSLPPQESETLTNNLGSELLKKTNVVLNHENLRLLAILHESLVRMPSLHSLSLSSYMKFSPSILTLHTPHPPSTLHSTLTFHPSPSPSTLHPPPFTSTLHPSPSTGLVQ